MSLQPMALSSGGARHLSCKTTSLFRGTQRCARQAVCTEAKVSGLLQAEGGSSGNFHPNTSENCSTITGPRITPLPRGQVASL